MIYGDFREKKAINGGNPPLERKSIKITPEIKFQKRTIITKR